jgi:hypothetical protein
MYRMKVPPVRIIGLVLVIAVVVSAYEWSRSPIIGVLGVIGAVVAGMRSGGRVPPSGKT